MKALVHIQDFSKNLHGSIPFRIQELKIFERETVAFYGLSDEHIDILVNHLTGASAPEEGSVSILGIDTAAMEEEEWFELIEKVSVYRHSSPFQESASIGENIASLFRARNEFMEEPQLSASVLSLSNLVQLTITDLSKIMGEATSSLRMKVGLARTLAFHPKIVILYNPTGDFPPHVCREFVELLRRARRKRKFTLIIFTADTWLVEQLAERVIFLNPAHGVCIENQIRGWYHRFFPFLSPSPDKLLQLSMDILQYSSTVQSSGEKIGKD